MTFNPTEALKLASQLVARYPFLSVEDQEDVAVDAVMRLMEHHDGVRAWKAYLGMCVQSVALDHRRRALRRITPVADAHELDWLLSKHDEFAETESMMTLDLLVPQKWKAMAEMLVHGYSVDEIAQEIGVCPGTVKTRTFRLRREMKGHLGLWLN